ncbi:hypothetical protein FF2_045946 [Malus domestica]
MLSATDPEHREDDEALLAGDDDDIGAQVAPIVRLKEVAVTTCEEEEDAILDLKTGKVLGEFMRSFRLKAALGEFMHQGCRQLHQRTPDAPTPGVPCFPRQQLAAPTQRFPTPPVPGFPLHAMYKS